MKEEKLSPAENMMKDLLVTEIGKLQTSLKKRSPHNLQIEGSISRCMDGRNQRHED